MLLSKIIDLIKKGNSGFISSENVEEINIKRAASLENASKNEITFLEDNNKLRDFISTTDVSAIIIGKNELLIEEIKKRKTSIIIVENPRIAFAEILNIFETKFKQKKVIDDSANIANSCVIGVDCYIGPNVIIGENTIIGSNNYIFPGVVISENVKIGDNNIFFSNCVIYQNTIIKNNCIINTIGNFSANQPVRILNKEEKQVAKGITSMSSDSITSILNNKIKKSSSKIVVHRDVLVLF